MRNPSLIIKRLERNIKSMYEFRERAFLQALAFEKNGIVLTDVEKIVNGTYADQDELFKIIRNIQTQLTTEAIKIRDSVD